MKKSTFAITAVFVIVLLAVVAASFYVWQEMGVISLGFHGWLAITLGSVGIIGLHTWQSWLYHPRRRFDVAQLLFKPQWL